MFLLSLSLLKQLLYIYPQSGRVASSVRCCVCSERDSVFRMLGWFLAAKKRGSTVCDRAYAWTMTRELARGIWCETTWENMGASEQFEFLSFSEMTTTKGTSSLVSAEHWSSHKGNEEGVGAMLLSHITFELPIRRLMVSMCDDLQKMLILFNWLSVRKVGNHWPNLRL